MRLLVLHHDRANLGRQSTHYIFALGRLLQRQGVEVVHHSGLVNLPGADVVLLHVDLSVVPDRFVRAVRDHPRVWNRNCLDIRKRCLPDRNLVVAKGADHRGPVIVKTDLNCGGGPERDFFRRLKWTWDLRELRLGFRASRGPEGKTYPIYQDMASVPEHVWKDASRVVEKFVPEREGDAYVARWAYFFGDNETAFRSTSRDPVVRWQEGQSETLLPVPVAISDYRRRIGLDYGKIDYVEHEGRQCVLDVNKTIGGSSSDESESELSRFLTRGFQELARAAAIAPALVI